MHYPWVLEVIFDLELERSYKGPQIMLTPFLEIILLGESNSYLLFEVLKYTLIHWLKALFRLVSLYKLLYLFLCSFHILASFDHLNLINNCIYSFHSEFDLPKFLLFDLVISLFFNLTLILLVIGVIGQEMIQSETFRELEGEIDRLAVSDEADVDGK